MSVDMSFVTYYGVMVQDKELQGLIYDHYDECEYEGDEDYPLDVLIDGMCGEYILIGYQIANLDPHSDNDSVEYTVDNLDNERQRMIKKFKNKYPGRKEIIERLETPWKMIALIHYS